MKKQAFYQFESHSVRIQCITMYYKTEHYMADQLLRRKLKFARSRWKKDLDQSALQLLKKPHESVSVLDCGRRSYLVGAWLALHAHRSDWAGASNRRRAVFVLDKIEEILSWEQRKERERDTKFVELGRCLCEVRAGQYWRLANLKSFDEFLERRSRNRGGRRIT